MNDWIKIQKQILFVPVVNWAVLYIDLIYYKWVKGVPDISKNVLRYASVCMLPLYFIAGVLIKNYESVPVLVYIGKAVLYYFLPLSVNYVSLRLQCKKLNVTCKEIGENFGKFLLLKKGNSSSADNENTNNVSDS